MYSITYKAGFEAAHFLPGHVSCGKVHGHSYKVFVTLESRDLIDDMVMDFHELKFMLNTILPDHQLLNDVYDFIPTAENLARYFYKTIKNTLAKPEMLLEVEVFETENASATYYEATE